MDNLYTEKPTGIADMYPDSVQKIQKINRLSYKILEKDKVDIKIQNK